MTRHLQCSGGLKFGELNFQATAALASTSVMTLACITLVIPAACARSCVSR